MLQSVSERPRVPITCKLIKVVMAAAAACLWSAPMTATANPDPRTSAAGFTLLEQHGPHPVGLRVLEQYDYSRVFKPAINALGKAERQERARPLQTLIWYPATATNSKTMTFGEYVSLHATQISYGEPQSFTGADEVIFNSMRPSFGQHLWAVRDGPLERGKFPVIIYAPSFSSVAWENVDLCEYLASEGYVVIAAPAKGVGPYSTHDVAGTNAQAQDISFLIGFANSLADADTSEIGVVGFSWGGLAELFAAARDDRIKALVALDGSMRYFPWVVQEAGDVHPAQMTIPLLYFTAQATLEDEDRYHRSEMTLAPNVLNDWTHGDLFTAQMLGLVHPEFASIAQRPERFWTADFPGLQEVDYDRRDGEIGYAWMARYTRAFLDAYLKHDETAAAFLKRKPVENGVPAHAMGLSFRRAIPTLPTLSSFMAEVGRQGFDRTAEIYHRNKTEQPTFSLKPDDLASWADSLLASNHPAEAANVMKLAVELDPSSANMTALGEAYAKSGQDRLAIEAYESALAKNPLNSIAKDRLSELQQRNPVGRP